jgi:hypothetical protein
MTDLVTALWDFNKDRKFSRKAPLCVALVVTQHARRMGLPLNADALLTKAGGQVLGPGKDAVEAVLSCHRITRVLAAKGGRTSRGSISNMRKYVAFLNSLAAAGSVDLDAVEAFWIERVHEFFSAKPWALPRRCPLPKRWANPSWRRCRLATSGRSDARCNVRAEKG